MSNFRQYNGGPGWLFNPATGAIGYQNRSTGVDVELLSIQTTVAPNLNRVVAKSSNTTGKAAVGDVITVSAPPGVLLSNIQGMQDKSSTGGSATTVIAGFTNATYALTSAEIPPIGSKWPITVFASTSNEMADPLDINNPVVAPGAPTIGAAVAGNRSVSAPYTAPANNGGAAITSYDAFLIDVSNNVVAALTNVPNPVVFGAAQGVINGASYRVRVRANNSAGAGALSALSNSVNPGVVALRSFSSTENFAQGDQVLYAGGLYTFTAAHPAGNWTGNDVTYNGQNGDAPLNTVGFSKTQGVVSSWTAGTLATATTTTPTQSRGFKMDAEAPWTRMRAALFTREPTPMRGFALSVASTETDSLSTLSLAIDPIVNGSAHSVIRGADPYGFVRLTWGGALRSPVQPGCGVTAPGQGYTTNMSSVFSDWVDCASVPVVTGKRPMLVGRLSRIVSPNDANSNITNNALTGAYTRYLANDPTGRMQYHPLVGTNGDHVADPTLAKTGGALYDATANSVWQNMAWIFEHNRPTRVMGGFGDSITEGYGIWQNVVLQLSTPNAPFYMANFGCSTNRSAQYLALLESQLRGENYLTDIIMPTFSPNEPNVITDAMADAYIADLAASVALCAAFKKRVYLWTSYAALTDKFRVNATSVASINKINAYWRAEAAKPGSVFLLAEIADGYDDSTMTLRNGDNTHPNALGVAHFNGRILPVVQKGI